MLLNLYARPRVPPARLGFHTAKNTRGGGVLFVFNATIFFT
jgi:hypothetical protein